MALYHKDVYLPSELLEQVPKESIRLKYGTHAKHACKDDKFGRVVGPPQLNPATCDIFELEDRAGKLVKFLARMSYDHRRDITVVIACDKNNEYFVKTLWLNLKTDKHWSLNKKNYVKVDDGLHTN